MRSRAYGLAAVAWITAAGLAAQEGPLPSGSVNVDLPKDSPVALLSLASDQSRTAMRGAAMVLDLHMSLGAYAAQHGRRAKDTRSDAAGGSPAGADDGRQRLGHHSQPECGAGRGFPVRIDMQLVRPALVASGPLVMVDLDGVLFQDLTFYGPDRLSSRRYLTACEMEAQRDRGTSSACWRRRERTVCGTRWSPAAWPGRRRCSR